MGQISSLSGKDAHLDPYREALRTHGPSFEAMLWMSRHKQHQRFRVFSEIAQLTGRVILDAGCGLGDFAAWMNNSGIQYGKYLGLEALDEFVTAARRRELPETNFCTADFVCDPDVFERVAAAQPPSAPIDVVIFSGSLNTLAIDDAWRAISSAWQVAREGVLFNFLSSRDHPQPSSQVVAAPQNSPARRFDPLWLLDRALQRSPRVVFRQEYMDGHDATIAIFKPVNHPAS